MSVIFGVPYSLILATLIYLVARGLYRTKAPMYLFAGGSLLTVYLLYLSAYSASAPMYVLPFFGVLNRNTLQVMLNIVGRLALVTWAVWAVCYCLASDGRQ